MKTNIARALVAFLVAASSLVIGAGTADAAKPKLDDKIELDPRFEDWFSNGMWNDAAACGPFAASEEAVVWHMYVDVPAGTAATTIKDVKVDFGGKVETEVRYAAQGSRIAIWARVTVKDPSKEDDLRRGAHTSVEKVEIKLDDKVVPKDGGVTVQLGHVCYLGLGPIGEVTIYLQALVCDGFDRFKGNEIDENSELWDATGGAWQEWDKVYDRNAPTVKLQKKEKGCVPDGNQQFAVGTTAWMENFHVLPGTTSSIDGVMTLSSRSLPEAHQRALLWANEQLWFEWLDNQIMGAFQCFDDRLHADAVEWIMFENYNKLPEAIYCVAWNVEAPTAPSADGQ